VLALYFLHVSRSVVAARNQHRNMGCGGSKEFGDASGVDEQTYMFLTRVKLLKRLPQEELPELAKRSTTIDFKPGQSIITQGDEGNEFFMIKKGNADVEIDGKKVASLKGGDYFGENALLRNEPRTATIKATTEVKALKITRKTFTGLGLENKLEFAKRGAVAGGAAVQAEIKPPSAKKDDEVKNISSALQKNANLNTIAGLDEKKIKALTDFMWKENVPAGKAIIEQGDLQADYFYVVQSGTFDITIAESAKEGQSVESATAAAVGSVESGGSFGELALLYFAPRAATVTAKVDSVVWVLARHQFKEALKAGDTSIADNLKQINKCEVFSTLKDTEKKDLAAAMNDMAFTKDETIFDQGEKGTQFFLLVSGTVAVIKDGKEITQLTATADKAPFFGEKALLEKEPRAATIKVVSDKAITLYTDKNTFDMLLGNLGDLMKRGKDGNTTITKGQGAVAPAAGNAKRFGNIKFKDLKRIGLLGCGGFGAVELVEHTASKDDTYALKALSKGYVVKTGMQKGIMSEKDVQLLCNSPFVVMLYETYNGNQSLFFLLELALGGELYATYNKKNFWGKADMGKFYIAGTLFAFEHLHSLNIVYRDLKPENLLLTDKGRVKLTDMGLAKVCLGKTFTTCGTPDYFAPELIASKGHNHAVDWWTLGILTFELMSGHPPFESASPMQIYAKVQKGIDKVVFPKALKGDVEVLVKGLCAANPIERLPMKKGDTANIKKSPWFSGFTWSAMLDLSMTPPYVPVVKSKKDATNFSARKEDLPPQVPYKDPGSGWDKDFATSA